MGFGILLNIFKGMFSKAGMIAILILAAIVGLGYVGKRTYDWGYETALTEANAKKAEDIAEAVARYQKQVADAEKQTQVAEQAKQKAERIAAETKAKANTFYNKWQEALDNVQTETHDGVSPFTVGFVGMFNLAVKGKLNGSDNFAVTLPEVLNAAELGERAATSKVTDPASVSVKDVLMVVKANSELMNSCLTDRNQMRELLEGYCKQGFCIDSNAPVSP